MSTFTFWQRSLEFEPDYSRWFVPTNSPMNSAASKDNPNAYEIISHGSSWNIVRHTKILSKKCYSNELRCEYVVPITETYYHFFHINRNNYEPFGKKSYVYCGTYTGEDLDAGFQQAKIYYETTWPVLHQADKEYQERAAKDNKDFADTTVLSILLSIFKKGEQIQPKDCEFISYGASSWIRYIPPIEDMISWEESKGEKTNREFVNYLRGEEFGQIHSTAKNPT